MKQKTMTLEQYNKKYRNRTEYLIKLKKSVADGYNKKFEHVVGNQYLFNGRKWQLIGDTYYQIPRPISYTWFRNLHAGVQVATCALLGAIVVGGAASPLIINYVLNGVVVDSNEVIFSYSKDKEGNINANIKTKDNTYEIKSIVVKTKDYEFELNKDYTYDATTGDIKISADAIKEHKGRIHIVPAVTAVQLEELVCSANLSIKYGSEIPGSDLNVQFFPTNAHDKFLTGYKLSDDAHFTVEKTADNQYKLVAKAGEHGDGTITLFAGEGNSKVEAKCVVKVEEADPTYEWLTFNQIGQTDTCSVCLNETSYQGEYPKNLIIPSKAPENVGGWTVTQLALSAGPALAAKDPGVETVLLPETLTEISSMGFKGWTSLKSVNFNGTSNLTKIYSLAFEGCTSLDWFKISNKIENIYFGAFNGCTSIKFVLENDCERFSLSNDRTALFDKNKTILYSMSHASGNVDLSGYTSLTKINEGVFYNNTNLTGITLPKSLTLINNHAFFGSNLETAVFLDTTHNWEIIDDTGSEPVVKGEVAVDKASDNAINLKKLSWANYYWTRKD